MNKIDELLEYIQKTNPGMTRERILEELSASTYTSKAILFTMESVENCQEKF
jgi:putative lipoic acid-binding regulatory protein